MVLRAVLTVLVIVLLPIIGLLVLVMPYLERGYAYYQKQRVMR